MAANRPPLQIIRIFPGMGSGGGDQCERAGRVTWLNAGFLRRYYKQGLNVENALGPATDDIIRRGREGVSRTSQQFAYLLSSTSLQGKPLSTAVWDREQ